MEQLLFILFVLFSIGSAILQHRKESRRRRERTAGTQTRRGGSRRADHPPRAPEPVSVRRPVAEAPQRSLADDEPGPDEIFPGPFSEPAPTPRRPASPLEMMELARLEAERQAIQAERRALEAERRALEAARQAQQTQADDARRRVSELVQEHVAAETASRGPRTGGGPPLLPRTMDVDAARRAVVYSEILGPPRAWRMHEVG